MSHDIATQDAELTRRHAELTRRHAELTRRHAEDHALWRRSLDGDVEAKTALVKRLYPNVRRFFVNKAVTECEDLAQKTMVRFYEALHRYAGRASLRAYILGIARNVLLEFIRERKRNATLDLDDVTAQALDPRPSSLLCKLADQRMLLEALRSLSVAHQMAFELHYWEKLTDTEMAEVLDCSPNTSRSRLSRAKEQLQKALDKIGSMNTPLPPTDSNLDDWARRLRPRED